jgi:hypothetical protein
MLSLWNLTIMVLLMSFIDEVSRCYSKWGLLVMFACHAYYTLFGWFTGIATLLVPKKGVEDDWSVWQSDGDYLYEVLNADTKVWWNRLESSDNRHLHVPYAWYHLDKLATTKYRTKWMVVGVTEAIKCGCQLVPSYAIYLQIKVPGTTSMSPSRFPSINTVFLSLCSVWKQCVMCWLQLLQVAVKYFE